MPTPSFALWEDKANAPQNIGAKYAEAVISAEKSIIQHQEGTAVDAGLALGRSFRVGWGPSGVLVHLGQLCGPRTSS